MKDNKITWKDVKSVLSTKEKSELLKLIADLYSLNTNNKLFVNTRYSAGEETLKPYMDIISVSLYPDVQRGRPIRLLAGKKAISDYYKATKDETGKIELMTYYLETGNRFTLDYGDIDEPFYNSLESMFYRITKALIKQPEDIREYYISRLEYVVSSADGLGWGYYDNLCCMMDEYKKESDK